MAANLAGMFSQLNKGIQGFSGMAQPSIDMMSQGFGGVAATGAGMMGMEDVDPMSFMNEGGKQLEGTDDLSKISVDTPEGMIEAAGVYSKMGNTKQAVAMQTAATSMIDTKARQAEEEADRIRRKEQDALLIEKLTKEGNTEDAQLIASGGMTAADYYKAKYTNKAALALELAKDPYKGSFRQEVNMNGKKVPVLFAAGGEPIRVLGEGTRDTQIIEVYDPAIGSTRQALVDKNNPSNIQFLGAGQPTLPTYDIKESNDTFHVWQTPTNGGPPTIVGQYSNMTDAERAQKKATQDMRSINQLSTIDEAINMIDDDDSWTMSTNGVGGWKSWALKYIPGDQRNFEALIMSIKANVGFEELRTLKAEGGTLGQVSNIENILLQSAIRGLDTAQSPQEIKKALETIKGVKKRLRNVAGLEDPSQADSYFKAERDENNQVTGNKLYFVNESTIAKIGPNGEYLGVIAR